MQQVFLVQISDKNTMRVGRVFKALKEYREEYRVFCRYITVQLQGLLFWCHLIRYYFLAYTHSFDLFGQFKCTLKYSLTDSCELNSSKDFPQS